MAGGGVRNPPSRGAVCTRTSTGLWSRAGNRPGYPTVQPGAGDARAAAGHRALPGLPGGGLTDRPVLSDDLVNELLARRPDG